MLNALRLVEGFALTDFEARTGCRAQHRRAAGEARRARLAGVGAERVAADRTRPAASPTT
jgi:hypothetical protein